MTSSTEVQMLVPYTDPALRGEISRVKFLDTGPSYSTAFFTKQFLKYLVHKQTEAFFASQKDACFMNQNVLDPVYFDL